MNQPRASVTDDVQVSYRIFTVEDAETGLVDDPPSGDWYPTQRLTARGGIVYIRSTGHTHLPLVSMQSWDHEPLPENPGAWDACGEIEFVCRTGAVVLSNRMHDSRSQPLDLGSGPMAYHLRAHSRGHDRMRAVEDGDFDEDDEDALTHIEHYLLQIWPSRPLSADALEPFRLGRSRCIIR